MWLTAWQLDVLAMSLPEIVKGENDRFDSKSPYPPKQLLELIKQKENKIVLESENYIKWYILTTKQHPQISESMQLLSL